MSATASSSQSAAATIRRIQVSRTVQSLARRIVSKRSAVYWECLFMVRDVKSRRSGKCPVRQQRLEEEQNQSDNQKYPPQLTIGLAEEPNRRTPFQRLVDPRDLVLDLDRKS